MSLDELQKEINNLLYFYFNSIGVLQRDFNDPKIESTMDLLLHDLKNCKARIDLLLSLDLKEESILENSNEIIKEGEDFVSDGMYLIDKITRA